MGARRRGTTTPSSGCLSCHGNPLLQKQGWPAASRSRSPVSRTRSTRTSRASSATSTIRYDDKPARNAALDHQREQRVRGLPHQAEHGRCGAGQAPLRAGRALQEVDPRQGARGRQHRLRDLRFVPRRPLHLQHRDRARRRLACTSPPTASARAASSTATSTTPTTTTTTAGPTSGRARCPACWDCHESHDILPKSDPESAVNEANVGETCGHEGCHKGSSEQFGAEAAALIHQKAQAQEENPLLQVDRQSHGQARAAER